VERNISQTTTTQNVNPNLNNPHFKQKFIQNLSFYKSNHHNQYEKINKTYHHEAFIKVSPITFHDKDQSQCLKSLLWLRSYTLQQKSLLSTQMDTETEPTNISYNGKNRIFVTKKNRNTKKKKDFYNNMDWRRKTEFKDEHKKLEMKIEVENHEEVALNFNLVHLRFLPLCLAFFKTMQM